MKKMYTAEGIIKVCFMVEGNFNQEYLQGEAYDALKEEAKNSITPLNIKEIKDVTEAPSNWEESIYYGQNPKEETVEEFFRSNTEENKKAYEQYLILKARFEK